MPRLPICTLINRARQASPGAVAAVLLLPMIACGDRDEPNAGPVAPTVPVPAAVRILPDSITLLALGDTLTLRAIVTDAAGASIFAAPIIWTSSDAAIASINTVGTVTAVSPGRVVITAAAGTVAGSSIVHVRQAAAEVMLSDSSLVLNAINATARVAANVRDARGNVIDNAVIAWRSRDSAVVGVAQDSIGGATLTAVSPGTTEVIAASGDFERTLTVTVSQTPASISLDAPTVSLNAVGSTAELMAIVRDGMGQPIADAEVSWVSSAPGVASVTGASLSRGVITAVNRGRATITAQSGLLIATATAAVTPSMVVESIDPYLSTPATGHLWEMPVLVVRYLPPAPDGENLDVTLTGFPSPPPRSGRLATLDEMRRTIDVLDRRVKFMLEEGSRFRGYADPSALPSLGYRIVQYVTIYEPLPKGPAVGPCAPSDCEGSWHFPDYHTVLDRINAKYWVESRGVKEIWVWGYHFAGMVQPESNMSSPTTGDISNSFRWNDDLPIFNRTYTLYGYNFARSNNEAVHNHGHQLEAILGHVDANLFWKDFVGQFPTGDWRTGRAGWTHMPPNTTAHYDYHNPSSILSDIEDWRAEGNGVRRPINNARWRDLVYNWPTGTVPTIDWPADFSQGTPGRAEAQWYIYWMQNMPGRSNGIPFFGGEMTNWWQFTGDWDEAIRSRTGLATVPNGFPITIRNDYSGGVHLSAGGGLNPGETRTLHSRDPVTVSVWNCGKPGATGCIMDPYTLIPGKRYRVISHPDGPSHNLTIVEE